MRESKTNNSPSEDPNSDRRPYNSPIRRRQSAKTRERIVEAGAQLVHEFTAWDWKKLTFRAVSERAGVSERTVYRYFPTEGKLKNAVMQHLVKEAGVDLQEMKLDDFATTVAKTFDYLSSFAIVPSDAPDDPTFVTIDTDRRLSLLAAIENITPEWTPEQQRTAAAALDIFWNLPPFERLTLAWGQDLQGAVNTVSWVISLIQKAIEEDQPPP